MPKFPVNSAFFPSDLSTPAEISELLDRGTAEVPLRQEFEKLILSGKKLRIYLGIDPTGADLTLGHAVPLRKLRQFQKYGHQVILLFGTFTAKIGDPTGRSETRPPLSDGEIAANMSTYLEQAGKVLDVSKVEVVRNGDWLSQMTFEDVLKLASTFTVSQMLQRDMYQERIKKHQEISLVEFMYPLMQGYDPIPTRADVQIGGSDQLFNLMAGRQIMKLYGVEPQQVLTVPILEGIDGQEKMSKSLGNYIALLDSAREMFGKTMSIPDSLILKYFELATEIPLEEIGTIKKQLDSGENPRDFELRLAREIVKLYHGEKAATEAEDEFRRMFAQKGRPNEMPQIRLAKGEYALLDLVIKSGLAPSNSEARRLIQSGAVKIDDTRFDDQERKIALSKKLVLQVGKRRFCEFVAE